MYTTPVIGYLSGTVLHTRERQLILDVHGVGYLVNAPREFLGTIQKGVACTLFIYTHVREDELALYGFPKETEMSMFKLLLSVSGVGPKLALEIMNSPIEKVCNAIAHKEVDFLTRIPGIGKKTAERIIVDLQNKVFPSDITTAEATPPAQHDDIINALIALGYNRQHVVANLKKLPTEIIGEEAVIKYFLQHH